MLWQTRSPRSATWSLQKNSSYEANRRAWDSLAPDKQELYRISASAAIPTIFELEPRMTENSGDTLTLTPQKDGSGITGHGLL